MRGTGSELERVCFLSWQRLGDEWRHYGLLRICYRNLGPLVGTTNSLIFHINRQLSSSWLCGKKKKGGGSLGGRGVGLSDFFL